MSKSSEAFRTISEVADELGVPKHVLRFWEHKFAHIRPMKRGGGRRFYRPEDMELLRGIRHLLHREGYTIKGVQKILREQGVDAVKHRGKIQSAATSKAKSQRAAARQAAESGEEAAPAAQLRQTASTRAVREADHPRPTAGEVRKRILAAIAELEACQAILSDRSMAPSPVVATRGRNQAR